MLEDLWGMGHLHGDSERIFVNSSIGCQAQCSYCYLPSIGYKNGFTPTKVLSGKTMFCSLIESSYFVKGKMGSIISVGCFSECWDENNRQQTIDFIERAIELNNPIQLATKQFIDYKDIRHIANSIQWEGQLSINVSSSSIKYWEKVEKGTTSPQERFKSFQVKAELGIPCHLYIKPVLKNVTVTDVDAYCDVMKQYKVNAIVGRRFSTEVSQESAPIIREKLFYQKESDEEIIIKSFMKFGKVYNTSVEPINGWRIE